MIRLILTLLLAGCTLHAASQDQKRITILFTNDLHSRLAGFSPESEYTPLTVNDDRTVGGFARIAAILNEEKAKNTGTTLVVDAGDFLMGTLFQSLETETGFQLRLMKEMGYDAVAIGNHEFDYGPGKLASIIRVAKERGEIPALLLSNAVFSDDSAADDALQALAGENTLKRTYILERGGLRFGFFSLLGEVADENAAFAPPVEFAKQVSTAKKMVKELREQKCDIIICLSHSGVEMKKGKWAGEDVELAAKVNGIDVIISGHTHTRLEEPLMVNGVPVVQAGDYSRYVGKLVLAYGDGKVKVEDYSLIPVDDRIAGDPLVHLQIREQKSMISSLILNPIGLDYETPVAESSYQLECDEAGDFMNSNLAPVIADAIHSYVNTHTTAGTDISMVAVGVVRDWIVPGKLTAPDIFRIMSMGTGEDMVPGYPLARLFVTGKELKSVLEILQVAYKSAPANYCYYAGIRAEYNPGKGLLKKISKIEIIRPDGSAINVDFSKKNNALYSITANSYMLEFIGIIKKMSFGLINVVPKDFEGNPVENMKTAIIDIDEKKDGIQEGKEWLAIIEYLKSMKDTNGNGIPDIDQKYREPVKTFVSVAK
jgi:5'-nucleotidase / UDP-sugar diphosphatase